MIKAWEISLGTRHTVNDKSLGDKPRNEAAV